MSQQKQSNFWNTPLTSSLIKGKDVKLPEMLLGYFIGPVGGLLSSGIFTSILNTYFTDVLKLDLTFLTTLQLVSTILIVIANLVVGQLIERTRVLAGKARPWILLSALTLSVASVLMFIVPFEGVMKMVDRHCIQPVLFSGISYLQYGKLHSGSRVYKKFGSERTVGVLYQYRWTGSYGGRIHGIPDSGIIRPEGKSGAVVRGDACGGNSDSTDCIPAV